MKKAFPIVVVTVVDTEKGTMRQYLLTSFLLSLNRKSFCSTRSMDAAPTR
jgi:hypothetical protein